MDHCETSAAQGDRIEGGPRRTVSYAHTLILVGFWYNLWDLVMKHSCDGVSFLLLAAL